MRATLTVLLLLLGLGAQEFASTQTSVPDDPVVQQLLLKADEALQQQDVARACAHWQDILDRFGGKVIQCATGDRSAHPTDPTVSGDRFTGVRAHVLQKLRQLTPEQFAQYRKRMEPEATALLERGVRRWDEALLREAALRWPLLPAGRTAALTLLDLLLDAGRFDEALLHSRRLSADLAGGALDFAALIDARRALALHGLGRPAELRELAAHWSGNAARTLRIAGEERDAAGWMRALADSLPALTGVEKRWPPMDVARRRVWTEPLERNQESRDLFVFEEHEVSPRVEWFPVLPAVDDANVFWSDGLTLRGAALFSHDALWPEVRGPLARHAGRRNRNLVFSVLVDRDLAITALEGPPLARPQRAWQGFETIEAIPNRKLVAVDKASGALRWSHHAPAQGTPAEREFLRRWSVIHPPLARGDTLFALGTLQLGVFHHWLAALNRSDGSVLWRTYLGAGQLELNMFGNPVKEPVPLPLCEADGVIYCGTGMGLFCAVDALTGTLLWSSVYEPEGIPMTDAMVTYERHPGWVPRAPVIHGDRIFAAPLDALTVLSFERSNGVMRTWPATRRTLANPNSWFLGVHRGTLIVAGNTLTAVDCESGAVRWRSVEIPARGGRAIIEGLPAVVGDSIWTPIMDPRTRGSALHRYALDGGALLEEQEGRDLSLLGNLVVSDDALFIAGTETLTACFDREDVETRLQQEVRKVGAPARLHLQLGALLARRSEMQAAINALETALREAAAQHDASTAAAARKGLLDLWLDLATGFRRGTELSVPQCFDKAMECAADDTERMRVRLAMLTVCIQSQDTAAALRQCDELLGNEALVLPVGRISEVLGREAPESPAPAGLVAAMVAARLAERAGDARAAAQRWQQARERHGAFILNGEPLRSIAGRALRKLITEGGAGVYADLEAQAQQRFAAARTSGDEAQMRQVVEFWPESGVADAARSALVQLLIKHGKSAQAVSEVQRSFRDHGTPQPATLATYAELLQSLGCHDSAREVAQRLRRLGDTDIGGRTALSVATAIEQAAPAAVAQSDGAPTESLHVAWRHGSPDGETAAMLVVPAGASMPAGRVLGLVDQELSLLDGEDGRVIWSRPVRELQSPPHLADGRLLLHHDGMITAVELASGRELWRNEGERFQFLGAAQHEGLAVALVRTLDRLAALRLMSFDAFSGQLIHSVVAGEVDRAGLQFNAGMALVIAPGRDGLRLFDGLSLAQIGTSSEANLEPAAPFLSSDGLLVQFRSAGRRTQAEIVIVATDPHTGAEIWKHELGLGSCVPTGSDGRHLAFQFSQSRGAVGRRFTVLDLKDGTSRISTPLPANEVLTADTVFAGERVYQAQRMVLRTGSGLAERIRAYDLRDGSSPWSSADFSGANLTLRVLPTSTGILLRKSVAGGRASRTPASTLYGLDPASGTVGSITELGPVGLWSSDAGLAVCGRTVVATAGQQLLGLRAGN